MTWVLLFLAMGLVYVIYSFLPATIIFFVLDRYRPAVYTPRNRWLRFFIYLGVIGVVSYLLSYAEGIKMTTAPWLLKAMVHYVMPIPLYYLLRRLL